MTGRYVVLQDTPRLGAAGAVVALAPAAAKYLLLAGLIAPEPLPRVAAAPPAPASAPAPAPRKRKTRSS